MVRRIAAVLICTAGALALVSCRAIDPAPVTRLDAPAQTLSSRVATDVLTGNVDDLYPLLHPNTQELMTKPQLASLLKQFDAFSGKPLEAQLKRRAHGRMIGGTWGRRPVWKFWYALRTSKAAPGKYYLTVQIVEDGDVVRVAQVADVTISGDNPDLK